MYKSEIRMSTTIKVSVLGLSDSDVNTLKRVSFDKLPEVRYHEAVFVVDRSEENCFDWLEKFRYLEGKTIGGKKYTYDHNINDYVIYPEEMNPFEEVTKNYGTLPVIDWET